MVGIKLWMSLGMFYPGIKLWMSFGMFYPVQAEQIEEQRWLTTEMFLAMIDVVRGDKRGGDGLD